MSGHSTPFIPPLDTPEPAVFPSVIPPSPPAIQSSRYPSGPVSGAPSAGWEAQPQQAQLPLYGLPSTTFNYSPLPPVAPNGLSADYRGYPDFVGTGGTAPPVNAPVIPPHGTPWHAGGAIPLHHGPPPAAFPSSPWGAPRGWPSGGGVHYPTNWGPFMSPDGYPANFPAWGGGFGGWFNPGVQPPAQQEPPRRSNKETGDRMPRFTAGSHYGPVLTALQLQVVCETLELNPLITPVPDSGPESDKIYLQWNMLRESSLVHRSCDPIQVSWSSGRDEPATFPRMDVLNIVSEHYPWLVKVKAQNPEVGVSCGEVIEAIAQNMGKYASKVDYQALPANLRDTVSKAYVYNRSRRPDVPGGKMGVGLKRADFLGQMTTFGGLEADPDKVRMVCGARIPGYVVLRRDKREFMAQEEVGTASSRGNGEPE
ncbi:hypothetical protein Ac2012v2_001341 [Leucoagaricus gongylophorus]